MYTIRVYYNPTCTVCQSAEKSCKCHYFQPVFKQRNISFICGLHYSAFEYPRRQKKSAKGTLVWRRERDSNPCEIALKRFSSLCVYCLLAFLQSRTVPKKSRLHNGFSDKMTLKGIVRDGSNIISIFPYPSKIRKIGGMFGGMLYYFL